jgi:hypothetical protein
MFLSLMDPVLLKNKITNDKYSTIKVSQPTPLFVSPAVGNHQNTADSYEPAILYKSLGIGSKQILALAGVYGTIAFLSNAITTAFLTDQWGRRK